jgi:hypothetical protein
MSVFKGGLRTITGAIGRQNRERYRITTATVTIGVRGTDFEIVHVPPQAGSREVPAGTYDRVFEGVTSMQNKAGVMLLVSRDQTAFAALQGTTPPVLVAPPAALFGRPTPLPQITPQTRQDAPAVRSGPALVTPIDAPRMASPVLAPVQTAPVLTSPVLTPIDVAPATTLTPIQTAPVLTAPATTVTPVLTAPTTTVTPVLTAPTTTLTPILTAPTVTTAPVTTPIQTAPTKITTPIVPINP